MAHLAPTPVLEPGQDRTMILNMGPQHPSTHGVLRLVLEIDGEAIVSVNAPNAGGEKGRREILRREEIDRAISPQPLVRARELAGGGASICVVGDTPKDIEAARANFLSVIAVATGRYSFDELLQFQPEVCASSLADLLAHPRMIK